MIPGIGDLSSALFGTAAGQGLSAFLASFDLDQKQKDAIAQNKDLQARIEGLISSGQSSGQQILDNNRFTEGNALENLRRNILGGTEDRNANVLRDLRARLGDAMGFFDQSSGEISQGFRNRENDFRTSSQAELGRFDNTSSQVLRGLQNRFDRASSQLDGLGTQQRADINTQFDNLGAQQQSDLVSRGLGSSSVLTSLQQGTASERANSLGRLGDMLSRERIGIESGLSGDLERARAGFGAQRAGLGLGVAGTQAGLAGDTLNSDTGLADARLGFLKSFSDPVFGFQDQSNKQISGLEGSFGGLGLDQLTRFNAADFGLDQGTNANLINFLNSIQIPIPSSTPLTQGTGNLGQGVGSGGGGGGSGFDPVGAGIGLLGAGATGTIGVASGLGAGATLGAGKIIGGLFTLGLGALACLDEDTPVIVETGPIKRIKDVVVGEDRVLGSDAQFHNVVGMDHGPVADEAKRPYVEIKVGGMSLVVTDDHPIGGKPAGLWRAGEFMPTAYGTLRVDGLSGHGDVVGCDIMLEGNVDYVVQGGFLVRSVIGSFKTWSNVKLPKELDESLCR